MTLRREIDQLTEKATRHANADKNLHSRQVQQQQHLRQNDEAMTALTEELEVLSASPPDDGVGSRGWSKRKASWERHRKEQAHARDDLQRARESNTRVQTALQADAMSAQQKAERLQQRVAKLSTQHDRLSSAPTTASSTPESRKGSASEQVSRRDAERRRLESQYAEQNALLEHNIQEVNYRIATARAYAASLEQAAMQAQQRPSPHHATLSQHFQSPFPPSSRRLYEGHRPATPEGDLPGTHLLSTSSSARAASQPYSFANPAPSFPRTAVFPPATVSPFGVSTPAPIATPSTGSSGATDETPATMPPPPPPLPIGERRQPPAARARSTSARSGPGSPGTGLDEEEEAAGWVAAKAPGDDASGSGTGSGSGSAGTSAGTSPGVQVSSHA